MKPKKKMPAGAFDIFFNTKLKIYQFVFIEYNMETNETKIIDVIDIGKEKYKALFQAQELLARRLLIP